MKSPMANKYAFPVEWSAPEVAAVICKKIGTIWFDSALQTHPQNKFSYILLPPENNNNKTAYEKVKGLPSFQGGWAGYWGYDWARDIEKIPDLHKNKDGLPDKYLNYYCKLFAFDHMQGKGWYITQATSRSEAQEEFDDIIIEISSSKNEGPYIPPKINWHSNFSQDEYQKAVRDVIGHILAGDVFQVNLSRRIEGTLPDDFNPLYHYLHLRRINPAPYAVYINAGSFQILSSSPESFLSLSDGGEITSRPIKGTSSELSEEKLEENEKDRAENIMIVDLIRNDFSKICEDTSVEVTSLCHAEMFKGLVHLVSEIKGKLKGGISAEQALMACFPGGSITGAPKIESMKIIEQLERARRGPYCGAIGWISDFGSMETNIAIRTLICKGGKIWFNVGGGITALSDPLLEYEETNIKAKAILGSFS
ncbi:MAG: anthranilate synthase component I family protein [Pseudobdellovibrionaceae bacterium]|jgi:para-aminobenzoate synthetase component 1|nr:anthranilate synthase component I family protein [Pseudobdellovibrionaceae bacterium]